MFASAREVAPLVSFTRLVAPVCGHGWASSGPTPRPMAQLTVDTARQHSLLPRLEAAALRHTQLHAAARAAAVTPRRDCPHRVHVHGSSSHARAHHAWRRRVRRNYRHHHQRRRRRLLTGRNVPLPVTCVRIAAGLHPLTCIMHHASPRQQVRASYR